VYVEESFGIFKKSFLFSIAWSPSKLGDQATQN
jgi:hypothetical protein